MPKILTFPELAAHGIRLSRRQVDRLEAASKFPHRVQISPGRVGWLGEEIDAHVAAKIANRPARIGSNAEIVRAALRKPIVNLEIVDAFLNSLPDAHK